MSLIKKEEETLINIESIFEEYIKQYFEKNEISDFPYISDKENSDGNYKTYIGEVIEDLSQIKDIKFGSIIKAKEIKIQREDDSKKLLLLDLDETLIHTDFDNEYEDNNYDTKITIKNGEINNSYKLYIRPFAKNFIEEISKYFEIGIFTASTKEYADKIIDILDIEKKYIKYRLYKNNCIKINDFLYIKDLRIIKNIDLKNTVLLDNNLYSFGNQLSNGIIITSFYNNKNDDKLENIYTYLVEQIYPSNDVRTTNNDVFHFQDIYNEFI